MSVNLGPRGVFCLFAMAMLQRLGFPLPAALFLLGAGIMAGMHAGVFAAAFVAAMLGSVLGDVFWYQVGMILGGKAVDLLLQRSLETRDRVRVAERMLKSRGDMALVWGRFVPGACMIQPLAGIAGVRPWRFLAYDAAGAALYVGMFMTLGALFRRVARPLSAFTGVAGPLALGAASAVFAVYLIAMFRSRRAASAVKSIGEEPRRADVADSINAY